MSRNDFERLRKAVLIDGSLQEHLRASSAQGQDAFVSSLLEAGAERGLQIEAGDVAAALTDSRRAWSERWLP